MHFQMTRRAILETGATQVVKRGRLPGQNAGRRGMAFQAEQVLLTAYKHLRIHRSMGLVTTHAPLQTHRGVLESKGSTLVRMAFRTSDFVAARCL